MWTLSCLLRHSSTLCSLWKATEHTDIIIVHTVEAIELLAVEADYSYAFLSTIAAELKAFQAAAAVLNEAGVTSVGDAFLAEFM